MGYVVSLFLDTNEEDMDAASSFWVGAIPCACPINPNLSIFMLQ